MSSWRISGNQSNSVGNVSGGVVAVGPGATATLQVNQLPEAQQQLLSALAELRKAVSGVPLDPDSRGECEECVRSIEAEARKQQPDRARIETSLGRFASNIMAAGVVLRETLALRQPIETIAGLVGTSLTLLKLW